MFPRRAARLLLSVFIAAVASAAPALPASAAPPSPSPNQNQQQTETPITGENAPPAGSVSEKLVFGLKPKDTAGVTPRSAFRFRLDPGSMSTDVVSVYNYSATPLDLRLYPTDASTNRAGSFTAAPAAARAAGVGEWIRLALPQAQQFRVTARTRVDVAFRIVVPLNAEPGDHLGGIVVSLMADSRDAKGNKIKVDNRVSAPVTIRVSGQMRPQLSVERFHASYVGVLSPLGRGRVRISYTVRNTGNLVVGGTQRLELAGWFGQAATPVLADLTPLAPGSSTDVSLEVPRLFPVLRYQAAVALHPTSQIGDPTGSAVTTASGLWAIPWPQLGTVLLLALLCWALRVRSQKKLPSKHSASRGALRRIAPITTGEVAT